MKPFVFLHLLILLAFSSVNVFGQKKPLDHSVYDQWQHLGEKLISNNGNWVVYTIEPQEGDGSLVVKSADGVYTKTLERGYQALVTEDSRFLVFRIRPPYQQLREARIRKKKPEEFPKDSLGVLELGSEEVFRFARVKSYKTPMKSAGWLAYHLETKPPGKKIQVTDRKTDSLQQVIDSLRTLLATREERPKKGKKKKDMDGDSGDALNVQSNEGSMETGSELVVRELATGKEQVFSNVLDYVWSETGNRLLVKQRLLHEEVPSQVTVTLHDLGSASSVTLTGATADVKNLALSRDGSRAAFVGLVAGKTDPVKFYSLWYYQQGWDSARLVADRYAPGMPIGQTVSEFASLQFSRSGQRLLFGTAPNPVPRDSSVAEIDIPKLDIWHYNDDYLQSTQTTAARLRAAQQLNYVAVFSPVENSIQSLGCRELPVVQVTDEGEGRWFFGISDLGKRVSSQWEGTTARDIYAIDPATGTQQLIARDVLGNVYPSPGGTAIAWFDRRKQSYFGWAGDGIRNLSEKVPVPLWNEEHDSPSEPNNYGVMGWQQGDSALYVYDRFDVWKLDLSGDHKPVNITREMGRRNETELRYVQLDPEKRSFGHGDVLVFRTMNRVSKQRGIRLFSTDGFRHAELAGERPLQIADLRMAKENQRSLIYTKETFNQSPDLYYARLDRDPSVTHHDLSGRMPVAVTENRLSSINPQQSGYLWGTASLFHWKAYNGKNATGILYRPENFDPRKKYPMIIYFYEKLSQDLFDYKEPAPIRSALNIPFFVSRGYVVFLPDISYTVGHPGKSAYDYVVSGARAVVKSGGVDSTRIGIQGHSWGGYQAAQLATMTRLFRAVWAGAPVANMTSAYGGIRWETGISRQFQYEKTQSRLGVTPWENLSLYIENSPLFHLHKVTAPMVILHNDADGAVPWYQGIELFTGLRRLGKKAWLLNYNGQGHGLTQRQDMRDYQVRMQQFFDWVLKDEAPARWITEGIPAVDKGRDLGY